MDYETANKYFTYDSETGILLNRVNRGSQAKSGEEAGHVHRTGYRVVKVQNIDYLVHRVIWLMVNKIWPSETDHINGVKIDNKISNLREVTSSENNRNRPLPKNNKSGIIGVRWHEKLGKWQVQIMVNRATTHLGITDNLLDAACLRKTAEIKHGYHPNHGRLK